MAAGEGARHGGVLTADRRVAAVLALVGQTHEVGHAHLGQGVVGTDQDDAAQLGQPAGGGAYVVDDRVDGRGDVVGLW